MRARERFELRSVNVPYLRKENPRYQRVRHREKEGGVSISRGSVVNAKLIEGNDIFRAALQGNAGRLVFSGEFTPLNIFAISLGSARRVETAARGAAGGAAWRCCLEVERWDREGEEEARSCDGSYRGAS